MKYWWMKVLEWEALSVIEKYNLRKVKINHQGFDAVWYRPQEKGSAMAIPVVRLHLNGSWDANLDVQEWASPPRKH